MSEGVCHFALGLSRKHEDLIAVILVFLRLLNITFTLTMFSAHSSVVTQLSIHQGSQKRFESVKLIKAVGDYGYTPSQSQR